MRRSGREYVEKNFRGLLCSGDVIYGDTEGDASIPYGLNELPPYVDNIKITVPGEGEDLYDLFDQHAIDEIAELLLEGD